MLTVRLNQNLEEELDYFIKKTHKTKTEVVKEALKLLFEKEKKSKQDNLLNQFNTLISTKSKNAIKIDKNTILNPHSELTNDIS